MQNLHSVCILETAAINALIVVWFLIYNSIWYVFTSFKSNRKSYPNLHTYGQWWWLWKIDPLCLLRPIFCVIFCCEEARTYRSAEWALLLHSLLWWIIVLIRRIAKDVLNFGIANQIKSNLLTPHTETSCRYRYHI